MSSGFEIAFTKNCWIDEGTPFRAVRLRLGDFIEEMDADLTNWSAKEYETQWLSELNRIVASQNKGALITSIHDPSRAFRIWTWTMWKENDEIIFQNRLLFMLKENNDFKAAQVSDHIGEYKSHNENGNRISQWAIPIIAIRDFINERSFALGE